MQLNYMPCKRSANINCRPSMQMWILGFESGCFAWPTAVAFLSCYQPSAAHRQPATIQTSIPILLQCFPCLAHVQHVTAIASQVDMLLQPLHDRLYSRHCKAMPPDQLRTRDAGLMHTRTNTTVEIASMKSTSQLRASTF